MHIEMDSNMNGGEKGYIKTNQTLAKYRVSIAGYLRDQKYVTYSINSHYEAKTSHADLSKLFFNSMPSQLGFYDANIFFIRDSSFPMSIKLKRYSQINSTTGDQKIFDDNNVTNSLVRFEGQSPKTRYTPAIRINRSRNSGEQAGIIRSQIDNFAISVRNSSKNNISSYSLDYFERSVVGASVKERTSREFSLTSQYKPNEIINLSNSIDYNADGNLSTTNLQSGLSFTPSKQFRLNSNVKLYRSLRLSGIATSTVNIVNNLRYFTRSGNKLALFFNGFQSINEQSGSEKYRIVTGGGTTYRVNVSSLIIKGRFQNTQSYITSDAKSSLQSINSSNSLQLSHRLGRTTRLRLDYNLRNQFAPSRQNVWINAFNYGLVNNMIGRVRFDIMMENQIYYDLILKTYSHSSLGVQSKFDFFVMKIPVLIQNHLILNGFLSSKTKLMIRNIRFTRNLNLSVSLDQETKSNKSLFKTKDLLTQDDNNLLPVQMNSRKNYASIMGSYNFFAYNIGARALFSFEDGKAGNSYNISIKRIIPIVF